MVILVHGPTMKTNKRWPDQRKKRRPNWWTFSPNNERNRKNSSPPLWRRNSRRGLHSTSKIVSTTKAVHSFIHPTTWMCHCTNTTTHHIDAFCRKSCCTPIRVIQSRSPLFGCFPSPDILFCRALWTVRLSYGRRTMIVVAL